MTYPEVIDEEVNQKYLKSAKDQLKKKNEQ